MTQNENLALVIRNALPHPGAARLRQPPTDQPAASTTLLASVVSPAPAVQPQPRDVLK